MPVPPEFDTVRTLPRSLYTPVPPVFDTVIVPESEREPKLSMPVPPVFDTVIVPELEKLLPEL